MNVDDSEPRPYIAVISGAPGSGTTTLGWALSRRLHAPFISRDDINTALHVTHHSDNPKRSAGCRVRRRGRRC
jgi:predicted kinase